MKKKLIFALAGAFILYIFLFGAVIFLFEKQVSKTYIEDHPADRFYGDETGADRAVLVDEPRDSAIVRINMIETARETLDISYYSMASGKVTDTFWGLLLEAADRGVQVRIILDGIANGLKGDKAEILYAIKQHPNIELKFYEPINVWKPWTLNNRLHDKYIIADETIAVIGGRNIGDRFMVPDGYEGEVTFDRDVVIFNNAKQKSVIPDLTAYFNKVYNGEYAKDSMGILSKMQEETATEKIEEIKQTLQQERSAKDNIFNKQIDWTEVTYPTNKITFIHNPIERFSKEPWVWYEMTQLFRRAEQSIFLQSPYIVPTKRMMSGFFNEPQKDGVKLNVLTNSSASTPNYLAFSVYLLYRKQIIESGAEIFEYHGEHSIHTKAYGIDDDISLIGSFNIDPRSAFLSTETMVVIHSKDVKQQLDDMTNDYEKKSLLIGEDGQYVVEEDSIEERSVSTTKAVLLRVIGYCGRIFEFLL